MDRNQQFHSPALPPLTKAGELNLKDVLRKQGTKSHLQPRSSSFRWIARNGWKLASKCLNERQAFWLFNLFPIGSFFFPNSMKRKRMEGCQTSWPKISICLRVSQLISAQWSSQMWYRNWSTKRINSWNIVLINFAQIVRIFFFS